MKRVLITGGCGFIGVNTARRLLEEGWSVTVVDNLSRTGTPENLSWLSDQGTIEFIHCDVRSREDVEKALTGHRYDLVVHLAGQVAVTTSIVAPRDDFEINALGTFNVLDAVRRLQGQAFFINASTNKVYGNMEEVGVREQDGRYGYTNYSKGIPETYPLDFHSPYGCSKGTADQYVIDFGRIYGLLTVSFRQSCIYGYRQFGVEDQGWVAWFTIAKTIGSPVTIYGDGKQVRDVLFIDDLVDAYLKAYERRQAVAGRVYNLGGGPKNTLSLLELLAHLDSSGGVLLERKFSDWRLGDQKVFVCDISKVERELHWKPKTTVLEGLSKLSTWVDEHRGMFEHIFADRLS